jgi:hypothetical protein
VNWLKRSNGKTSAISIACRFRAMRVDEQRQGHGSGADSRISSN